MNRDTSTAEVLHEWIEFNGMYNRDRRRLVEIDGQKVIHERREKKNEDGEWVLHESQEREWEDVPAEFVEVQQ